MTMDDELKQLAALSGAEKSFNAKLDELVKVPAITRRASVDPMDGYFWSEMERAYLEGNDLFRARIKAARGNID